MAAIMINTRYDTNKYHKATKNFNPAAGIVAYPPVVGESSPATALPVKSNQAKYLFTGIVIIGAALLFWKYKKEII